MKQNSLKTKYADEINRLCPHNYYPRPQMKRDSFFCLNGEWDFEINNNNYTEKYTQKILVPFCPESSLSGIERHIGKKDFLHYRKLFTLPEGFVKDRVILHIDACDQECAIYLNGSFIGTHKGGYFPISVDITYALSTGENELRVTVIDRLDKRLPYGKQTKKRGGMWYTPVSGIWQSVWIESLPYNFIRKLKITPLNDGAKILIEGGENKKTLKLFDGEELVFYGNEITLRMPSPKLWSPEDPNLYRFTLESGKDKIESYFAIRTVDIQEINGVKRICLNGSPYVFNGVLDQGYYPDGIFTPATIDGYLDDIRRIKDMGFNMLRKHIKIEPAIFYYLCDTEGIAVFQDMVNNSDYSFILDTALPTVGLQVLPDTLRHLNKQSRSNFESSLLKTAELLYNTPSVVYYTIFNEGWGQFCSDDMYELLKTIDPTRIIDTTSGWFRGHQSDVDSRHVYFKPLIAKKRKDDPLVFSEFGGYSYRVSGHLYGEKNYGYKTFDTQEAFEDALVDLYENQVIPFVKEGASAFVLTQLSDVEDETNGLITYDRQVIKVDSERLKKTMEKITNI